jgi:hypothetical protein
MWKAVVLIKAADDKSIDKRDLLLVLLLLVLW